MEVHVNDDSVLVKGDLIEAEVFELMMGK